MGANRLEECSGFVAPPYTTISSRRGSLSTMAKNLAVPLVVGNGLKSHNAPGGFSTAPEGCSRPSGASDRTDIRIYQYKWIQPGRPTEMEQPDKTAAHLLAAISCQLIPVAPLSPRPSPNPPNLQPLPVAPIERRHTPIQYTYGGGGRRKSTYLTGCITPVPPAVRSPAIATQNVSSTDTAALALISFC